MLGQNVANLLNSKEFESSFYHRNGTSVQYVHKKLKLNKSFILLN